MGQREPVLGYVLHSEKTLRSRIQKQPSRGVLKKRCSENMQQSYRRTPMLKLNFIEIALRHGCSLVNLLHIFRTPFLKNTAGWLLLSVELTRKYSIFI